MSNRKGVTSKLYCIYSKDKVKKIQALGNSFNAHNKLNFDVC